MMNQKECSLSPQRAHNALEIDGLNYSRFAQDFYGSALNFVGKVGDCTIMEGIVDHRRLVSSNIPNNKVRTTDGISIRTHSSLPGFYINGCSFKYLRDSLQLLMQWFPKKIAITSNGFIIARIKSGKKTNQRVL